MSTSSNRAPDNMDTETIRRFVQHAEDRILEWSISVRHNREMLENSERALANVREEFKVYMGWLTTRNQEAAEND